MQYFFQPEILDGADSLNEEESAHCIKVFRHKEGDIIGILDGKGGLYEAVIKEAHPKKVKFTIQNKKTVPPPAYDLHLAIAPTKSSDRMEWLTEKLTEIGISSIHLIYTQNSERRKYRIDRLEKKMIAALKQSKNPFAPHIYPPVDLKEFLSKKTSDQKFVAFVDPENKMNLNDAARKEVSTTILIGPEGDFTKEEIELCKSAGYAMISLGGNILRTETAGLVAVHTLHLINT